MELNEVIEKKVKVFLLVQIKEIVRSKGQRLFIFDEDKTAICLGTMIDDLAISLVQNKIYPIFNYSNETKLNTYYLYDVYDYGTKIPREDGYIVFEEEHEKLVKQYKETVDWYYNNIKENEKNNVICFDKQKAMRYERSSDV